MWNMLKKYSRAGVGFGFSFSIEMFAIEHTLRVYHNALVFNPINKGDVVGTSMIEVDFGMF